MPEKNQQNSSKSTDVERAGSGDGQVKIDDIDVPNKEKEPLTKSEAVASNLADALNQGEIEASEAEAFFEEGGENLSGKEKQKIKQATGTKTAGIDNVEEAPEINERERQTQKTKARKTKRQKEAAAIKKNQRNEELDVLDDRFEQVQREQFKENFKESLQGRGAPVPDRTILPSAANALVSRPEGDSFLTVNPVDVETFDSDKEFASGTERQGTDFLTDDESRGPFEIPSVDFAAGEKGKEVAEDFGTSAGIGTTAAVQLGEGVVNIPSLLQDFARNPEATGTAIGENLADTLESEVGTPKTSREFETKADQITFALGSLAGPAASATTSGSSVAATASGITDDAGLATTVARNTGATQARQAGRKAKSKIDDFIGEESPQEFSLGTPSKRSSRPDPLQELDEEIDLSDAPDLKQRFSDDPGQRKRRGAGPVDRPEEGLTTEEVKVLTGKEPVLQSDNPNEPAVIDEGVEGGIKEAFTEEKRIFASGEDVKTQEGLSIQDLKDAATKERKGQARLVTKQDSTGRDIDFEKPADTLEIDRPARKSFDDSRKDVDVGDNDFVERDSGLDSSTRSKSDSVVDEGVDVQFSSFLSSVVGQAYKESSVTLQDLDRKQEESQIGDVSQREKTSSQPVNEISSDFEQVSINPEETTQNVEENLLSVKKSRDQNSDLSNLEQNSLLDENKKEKSESVLDVSFKSSDQEIDTTVAAEILGIEDKSKSKNPTNPLSLRIGF